MIKTHLPQIKGLIIDMDGVLWHDTEPLGDLPRIFSEIAESGYRVILATNNATRTVDEYHVKLKSFGVVLDDWQVINVSEALANYLQAHYAEKTKIYVVGQPSLKETLSSAGFSIVGWDEPDVEIVVASLDYQLTYDKLKEASLLIQKGCVFIGTNPDVTLPTPIGFLPGSGTIIGAIEIATGQKPIIIGKPEPLLYKIAMKRLGVAPDETLAIGDRLETDIAGGQAAGLHTALVLSGASSKSAAAAWKPAPDIIIQDLTSLVF